MAFKKANILRTLFSVTGLIILSKLIGFVKQMVVADIFGTTLETDLINLSQGFIGDIQYVLVQALMTSMVSVYIYTSRKGKDTVQQFAMDTLKAFTLVAAAITALVFCAAPWLSRLIAPSYSDENSAVLSGYLRLFSPALLLFVWISVFQALMNANKRFLPGEIVNLNQSVIMTAVVLISYSRLGVRALVVSFFAYAVWNTLFLGFLSRNYWRPVGGNPFANPDVRKLLRMIAPLLVGYSIVYVNQMVDKILVSGLEEGAVTALNYGAVLSNLVSTFIVSFGSILFSYVTTHISNGEDGKAADVAMQAAQVLALVFLPISILTVLCSRDIVSIAFGRGAFGADSVRMAGWALAGYGFTFVPLVFREIFSRVQYGYQDSRRPMINSTIGIIFNIALSIALCPRFGVFGVSFASSVSVCVCGVLNMITARRHNAFLQYGHLLRSVPLLLAGGIVCGAVTWWGLDFWQGSSALVRFLLITLSAGGSYLIIVSPLLWKFIRKPLR